MIFTINFHQCRPGRIRTYDNVRCQIYNLMLLTTQPPSYFRFFSKVFSISLAGIEPAFWHWKSQVLTDRRKGLYHLFLTWHNSLQWIQFSIFSLFLRTVRLELTWIFHEFLKLARLPFRHIRWNQLIGWTKLKKKTKLFQFDFFNQKNDYSNIQKRRVELPPENLTTTLTLRVYHFATSVVKIQKKSYC